MSPDIRRATLDDAAEIARFHVRIWRETYGAIAPAEAVQALDEARRLRGWQATLAAPGDRQGTLLALSAGALVGLVSFGPPQHPVFGDRGEIKHLYVQAEHRGTGLGRHLLAQALPLMRQAGYTGVGLAVVTENTAARRFYAGIGGTEVGAFEDPGPLWRSRNILVDLPLPAAL